MESEDQQVEQNAEENVTIQIVDGENEEQPVVISEEAPSEEVVVPFEEVPAEEVLVEEAVPVEETPVEEVPAEEPHVEEVVAPVDEEVPVEEAPSEDVVAPFEEVPTDEAPIEETPVEEEAPVEEAPVEETPIEETPVEETPVEETPVEEVPVEETPIEEEAPVEEVPVEEVPVEETPAEEVPVEEVPVQEVPVEEVPVEEVPVEEMPVEETPVEEVHVEEAPAEEVPVEETPVEEVPVEEVPVEETPVEEVPVEEAPANDSQTVPSIIFIVPYRDRQQHYSFFSKHMVSVLSDYPKHSYKIYYIHQTDRREFNRGALKNIGFLKVKDEYPNDYSNITLVFNDIDTMPFNKGVLDYATQSGKIKHFYGLDFALGGIVSITAGDFEKINGFPNLWTWGYEDNLLNKRALANNLVIDRSVFYPLADKNILQLYDGTFRNLYRSEFDRFVKDTNEGINTITNLTYTTDDTTGFVDIQTFSTGIEVSESDKIFYDIRKGSTPFKAEQPTRKQRVHPRFKMGMF